MPSPKKAWSGPKEWRPAGVSGADKKVLSAQNERTLAEWWSEINHWGWVKELGTPDPIPDPWRPDTRRGRIMEWIEQKIGMELILRVHNVHRRKAMTDDQFSEWWTMNQHRHKRSAP